MNIKKLKIEKKKTKQGVRITCKMNAKKSYLGAGVELQICL